MNLVTASLPRITCWNRPDVLGRMYVPDQFTNIEDTQLVAAADNGAFSDFKPDRFMAMLEALRGADLKFVTAPDVVGDARATLELFDEWEPVIRSYGLPVALVGQDGLENLEVPWDRMDAYFIGGTTAWKTSPQSLELCREAQSVPLWVHMGRVNTYERFSRARWEFRVDSIDGSKYGRWSRTHIPVFLSWLENPAPNRLEMA